MPVLRDREVARGGFDHRGQDAGADRRGRQGGPRARRHHPDGHDDRHVERTRPRCDPPGSLRAGRARGAARSRDPGAVRAAGRPAHDHRPVRGRCTLDRHPRRVDGRRRAPPLDAGQVDRAARRVPRRVARGRPRVRAQPGLDVPAGRARRGPRRAGRRRAGARRHGRLPLRRAVQAVGRHARDGRRRRAPATRGGAAGRDPSRRPRPDGGRHARLGPGRRLRRVRCLQRAPERRGVPR